jgi:hypothetical protein
VVEYLLGTIIKKLVKSDVSMWDPFKTSKMRVSIVDALMMQIEEDKCYEDIFTSRHEMCDAISLLSLLELSLLLFLSSFNLVDS